MATFSADLDRLFNELPFPDRFKAARDAGFAATEFTFPEDVPLGVLGDAAAYDGLKTALLTMPADKAALAFDPKRKKDFIAAFERMLDVADFLQCPFIHVPGKPVAESSADAECEAFAAALHAVGRSARQAGIKILIGFKNAVENPDFYPASTLEVLQLLDELNDDKAFGYLYDVYEAQTVEGGISNTLESLASLICHVRIAGVPLRDEPDNGEIDYGYVLSVLENHAFADKIGCSYTPRLTTAQGLKWMKKFV